MEVHAPSAAVSVAIMVSDRVQPAHREGMRGALFMGRVYCIAIPAGIRSATIFPRPQPCPSRRYQRSRWRPISAPTAITNSVASGYQVATNNGESSKQWKA